MLVAVVVDPEAVRLEVVLTKAIGDLVVQAGNGKLCAGGAVATGGTGGLESQSVLRVRRTELVEGGEAGPEMGGKERARLSKLCGNWSQVGRLQKQRTIHFADTRAFLARLARVRVRERPVAGIVAGPTVDSLPRVS